MKKIFITVLLLNTDFIDTPKEIVQAREIDNYELQLKVLNKKLEQVESTLANIEKRDNNLYRVYFEASPIPEDQRRAGFGGLAAMTGGVAGVSIASGGGGVIAALLPTYLFFENIMNG